MHLSSLKILVMLMMLSVVEMAMILMVTGCGGHSSSFDRHRSSNGVGPRGGVSRRSNYRVKVTGLPSSASWQDLKDHMRRAGDVCFSEVFRDGGGTIGIVDYTNHDDMKYAIRKLDDSEFRNAFSRAYIRVREYDTKRSLSRSRSHSRSYSRSRSRSRGCSLSRSKSPESKPQRHSLLRSRSKSASPPSRSDSKGHSPSGYGLTSWPCSFFKISIQIKICCPSSECLQISCLLFNESALTTMCACSLPALLPLYFGDGGGNIVVKSF